MRVLILIVGFVVFVANCVAVERSKEEVAYYQGWIGCKAPPLTFDSSDRTNYVEKTYQGKKVLMYGFEAGDFVNAPNLPSVTAKLQSLDHAKKKSKNGFVVVGFSRSLLWSHAFGDPKTPKQIEEISCFPVVNLNNKWDHQLGEPYEMLLNESGGILIDTNGVICAVFLQDMTKQDFDSIDTIPPWNGKPHDLPKRKEAAKSIQSNTPATRTSPPR